MTGMWITVGAAVLACYFWRALGVALSDRIDANRPIIRWTTCVAYAMLAATFVRLIVLPAGTLAAAPLDHRLLGCIAALAAFYLLRRNVLAGTAAGAAVVIALAYYGRPLLSI
jgi:branched-subunit amino acid transport protein